MLTTTNKPIAIHIDTLRTVFGENERRVLAVTRSMTKRAQRHMDIEDKKEEEKAKWVPVIEEMNSVQLKTVPRIITSQDQIVSAHKVKNKIIFQIEPWEYITNGNISLERLLSRLEKLAGENSIKKIKWTMDDRMFNKISIQEFKEVCHKILKNLSISLLTPVKLVLNENERKELIRMNHDNMIQGGHIGNKKLLAKLRTKYKWKRMHKDVATFIQNCEKCKLNKVNSHTREPMAITPTPQKPFEIIIIDTIGPLSKTENGYEYALTAICDLSKYLIMTPIGDKSATSMARALIESVILKFGPVKNIRTDRGTEYNNKLMSEICKLLNIKHDLSTAYHHQSVGSIERNHRTLNEYIRIYVTNIEMWDEYIQYYTYCYNTSKHSAFNNIYSPYELVYGRGPIELSKIFRGEIEPVYNIENYATELKYKLQLAHEQAQQFIKKNKEINKKYYDRKINRIKIEIGDNIKVEKEPRNKHKNIYEGPFKVIEIDENNITYLDFSNKKQTVHKNRVIKY